VKTLYLTDLDGTLLHSNERISDYTANVVNSFVKSGGYFSYATARSFVTASAVTAKLNTKFPVVCYNGGFIIENNTGEVLAAHYFAPDEIASIIQTLTHFSISPIVYSFINGVERFSYMEQCINAGVQHYLDSRQGDMRHRKVQNVDELFDGDIFYITCIGDVPQISPIYDIYKSNRQINSIYQKDIYSGAQWCELLPVKASKATAVHELKRMLGCNKVIVFGDGKNDLSLFSVADECYAVENAVPELKNIATSVIESNDNDGVAKWLDANAFNYLY